MTFPKTQYLRKSFRTSRWRRFESSNPFRMILYIFHIIPLFVFLISLYAFSSKFVDGTYFSLNKSILVCFLLFGKVNKMFSLVCGGHIRTKFGSTLWAETVLIYISNHFWIRQTKNEYFIFASFQNFQTHQSVHILLVSWYLVP